MSQDLDEKIANKTAPDDLVPTATAHGERARAKLPPWKRYNALSMRDLMSSTVDQLSAPKKEKGVPTGFYELDEAIGGWRGGNVTIMGAKPSFGKTSFTIATTCVLQDAKLNGEPAGYRAAIFSSEDSAVMYGKRFLARQAQISATDLRDLTTSPLEFQKAVDALAQASDDPFFIDATGKSSEWMVKAIAAISEVTKLHLIEVDYLQKVRAQKSLDRRNEIDYVVQSISDAIKKAGAHGLLLSHLSRGEKKDRYKPPTQEDLKESSTLEGGAEHVLLGYRDEDGNRILIVDKNKDGKDPHDIEPIVLEFSSYTASFKESTRYTEGPPALDDEGWYG